MATHELLQNAVKYSQDGRDKVRIEVRGVGERVRVRIKTRNRGNREDAEHIRRMIEETSMDANDR